MLGAMSEDEAESELAEDGGMSNIGVQASVGDETFRLAACDRNALIMSPMEIDLASSCSIDEVRWKWGWYADGVPRNAVGIPGYSSAACCGECTVRGASIFWPRRTARGSGAASAGPSGEPGKDIAIVAVDVDTLMVGSCGDGSLFDAPD